MDTKMHHTSYECFECSRKFSNPHALRLHSRMHEGKQVYRCQDCGKTFRMKFYFKYHRMNDTGTYKFECGICGKKFSNESCVDTHYKIHSNEKSFECRKCGKVYSQLGSFKNHITARPQTFTCKECCKVFTDETTLISHEQAHVIQKPYECLSCGKRFAHSFNLEIHSESYCTFKRGGKGPSTKNSISKKRSSVQQTTKKPHECLSCGKRFADSFNLEMHSWSYCTFQRESKDPDTNNSVTQEQRSVQQTSSCQGKRGGRRRGHAVKVEVIDLGSDTDPEEAQYEDYLPLEVCLSEGEEELSI